MTIGFVPKFMEYFYPHSWFGFFMFCNYYKNLAPAARYSYAIYITSYGIHEFGSCTRICFVRLKPFRNVHELALVTVLKNQAFNNGLNKYALFVAVTIFSIHTNRGKVSSKLIVVLYIKSCFFFSRVY